MIIINSISEDMERKDIFTQSEIENLRVLVKKYSQTNHAPDQKPIRVKLRKIGFYVSDYGIQNITPQDFERLIKIGKIKIAGDLFTSPKNLEKKSFDKLTPVFKNSHELNHSSIEKLTTGNFKKAESIDNLVPDQSGFYCIRLIEGSKLPERYQKHLNKRKHSIIYIGKAEGQSLKKRFLGQELRAKGHGTFFRSIGAVLNFLPDKGSLLHSKNKNNYTFNPSNEKKIITWINQNLEVNWITYDGDFSIEKEIITRYCPLLNDSHNPVKLMELKEDKAYCRAIANC